MHKTTPFNHFYILFISFYSLRSAVVESFHFLHSFCKDASVESGKMPLSIYSTKGDVLEEKKLKSEQVTRESSTARIRELLPGNLERAAAHAGIQLLSGCATIPSGNAFGKHGHPKKASHTNENKLMLEARYLNKRKTHLMKFVGINYVMCSFVHNNR